MQDHELTQTVFKALDDNSSQADRAEAFVQCLQVRRSAEAAVYVRQEMAIALINAGGDVSASASLSDKVRAAMRGSLSQRAAAFIDSLNADQDSAEVNDLVHNFLNPLRGLMPAGPTGEQED